jgi:hypothetical protein
LEKKSAKKPSKRDEDILIEVLEEGKNRGTNRFVGKIYGITFVILCGDNGKVRVNNIRVPPRKRYPSNSLQNKVILAAYNYFKNYPPKQARMI